MEPRGEERECANVQPKVLVVEDEVLIRILLADDLSVGGFLVLQAANGDEALKLLQIHTDINLVITDIRMPGYVDGLELAKIIRKNWPDIKVLILSANIPKVPTQHSADALLTKPYRVQDLLSCVNKLLGISNVKS